MKRPADNNTDNTIEPQAARERFVEAVKTRRVNPFAKLVVDMTVEQLMTDTVFCSFIIDLDDDAICMYRGTNRYTVRQGRCTFES